MPMFHSEEEIEHWLANQPEIITCYVVEVRGGGGQGEREREVCVCV